MKLSDDLTGIVCVIGLPDTNVKNIYDAIKDYIDKQQESHMIHDVDTKYLLDYNHTKPTGIFMTMIIPKNIEEVQNIPGICNALIDRYGGQRVMIVTAKAKISSIMKSISKPKANADNIGLIAYIKTYVELVEAANETLSYMTDTEHYDTPIPNGIRKCNYTAISYETDDDPASVYELNNNVKRFLMCNWLYPLATRVTEWNELYERILYDNHYAVYTNYDISAHDPDIMISNSETDLADHLISLKAAILRWMHSHDCSNRLQNMCNNWLDDIEQFFRHRIAFDKILPVRHIGHDMKETFLTSEGFLNKQSHIKEETKNVLLPKVKMANNYKYIKPEWLIFDRFKNIFGTAKEERKQLSELIRMCVYPGENRGKYVLISYDDNTTTELNVFHNVIRSFAHYVMKDLDTDDNNTANLTIGYPANATLVLLGCKNANSRVNPWKNQYNNCNHIFMRASQHGFHKALLEDPNVIHITLHKCLNPEDLNDSVNETLLHDIFLWAMDVFTGVTE